VQSVLAHPGYRWRIRDVAELGRQVQRIAPAPATSLLLLTTSDESQIGPNKHEARVGGGNDGINPQEHDKKYMGDDVLAAVDVLTTYSASRSHDDSTWPLGV